MHSKAEEITGTILGSSSIALGNLMGWIDAGDLHALVMAFLTGAVGGLGAWLVKQIANKLKSKSNEPKDNK